MSDEQRFKFGVHLNHEFDKGGDIQERIDHLIGYTHACRDLGLDSVFGMHHYLSSLATVQPLPLLARLIPESGDMQLGTGIYLFYEHPVIVAENWASLDRLSGGRLTLGLGAGYRANEFDAMGMDRDTRVGRMFEGVELLRELWSGEEVNHRGRHYTVEGERCSILPLQESLPIWLGANGEKSVRRVARTADAWIAPPNVKAKWVKGHLAFFLDELDRIGASREGREMPLIRELYIGDDDESAAAEVSDFLRNEYADYSVYGDEVEYWRTMFGELLEKAFLIGSVDTVAAKLEDFADAGFNHFIFRINWKGMPYEQSLRTLERLAADVMPRFGKVGA